MAVIDDLRRQYKGYDDDEIIAGLQATKYKDYSTDEIAAAIGYRPSLMARAKRGLGSTANAAQIGMSGQEGLAQLVAEEQRNQLPATAAQQKMRDDIAPVQKEYAESEGWGAVLPAAKMAAKRLAQFATNPREFAGMMVENLPNSLPGLAGSVAGGVAGGVAGPAGALAGSLAGGTAGGYLIEQGAAMREQIVKEAHARGVDPKDAAALEPIIAEKYAEFLDKARLKGIGTAGTDAVLTRLTLGLAGAGEKAIAKEAGALGAAAKAGTIGAEEGMTQLAALQARQAARNTLGAKVKRGAAITGAEMLGEGASEAAGQALAYGQVDPLDVIDESLMGLGQGVAMGAASKTASKALGLKDAGPADQALQAADAHLTAMQEIGDAQTADDAIDAFQRATSPDPYQGERIPVAEASELLPTGEATDVPQIPVGEATELLPTADATELPAEAIPVGEATEIDAEPVDAAPAIDYPAREPRGTLRTGELDPNGRNAVAGYINRLRKTNTLAARAYVREYEAGRITDADVMARLVPPAPETAQDRIEAAARQAPAQPTGLLDLAGARNAGRAGGTNPPDDAGGTGAPRLPDQPGPGGPGVGDRAQGADDAAASGSAGGSGGPGGGAVDAADSLRPGDLLTADNMPYGTRAGAAVRAKKEGGEVVAVEGGWIVRKEIERGGPGLAEPAGQVADAGAARSPEYGGSGGAVAPAAAGRVGDAAGAPAVGGGPADAVADGRGPSGSLTASWVIRERDTGKVIAETFDRKKVDALNTEKYEAVPVQEHLGSMNNEPKREAMRQIDAVNAEWTQLRRDGIAYFQGDPVTAISPSAPQELKDRYAAYKRHKEAARQAYADAFGSSPDGKPVKTARTAEQPAANPVAESPSPAQEGSDGAVARTQDGGGPQPLYASRPVVNADAIRAWAASQGFKTTLPADDLHVTVAYSREPVAAASAGRADPTLTVTGGKRTVEPLGDAGAVVLKFDSPAMQARWKQYRDAGASWDYDSYTPHITITYDGKGVDLAKVKPYTGPIELGAETQEALNVDKADDYKEAGEEPVDASSKLAGIDTKAERVDTADAPEPEAPRVYRSRKNAEKARDEAGNTKRLKKVRGGWILREATDKEQAAAQRNGQRLARRGTVDVENDSLLTAIAKLGGIAMSERRDIIGSDRNKNVGGKMLFTQAGKPLDLLADEDMRDFGYLPQAEIDRGTATEWLRAAIASDFMGTSTHYSEQGTEWIEDMQRQSEAAMGDPLEDVLADFTPDDLDAGGYTSASPVAQDLTEGLLAEAEAAGIDTETLRDDIARATQDATEDEYHAQLQEALRQVLAGAGGKDQGGDAGRAREGDRDRGDAAGQEGAPQEGLKRDPDELPDGVRRRLEISTARLGELRRELDNGLQAFPAGGARMESMVQERLPAIAKARETLDEFRQHAQRNGFDAEAVIEALGGDIDLRKYTERPAEKPAPDAAAEERKRIREEAKKPPEPKPEPAPEPTDTERVIELQARSGREPLTDDEIQLLRRVMDEQAAEGLAGLERGATFADAGISFGEDGDMTIILRDGVRVGSFVGKRTRDVVRQVLRGNAGGAAPAAVPQTAAERATAARSEQQDAIVKLRKRESALRSLLECMGK